MDTHLRPKKQLFFNALLCMLLVINSMSIRAFAGMGETHEAGSGPSQVIDRSRDTRVAASDTDGNTDNSTVTIPELDTYDVWQVQGWEDLYITLSTEIPKMDKDGPYLHTIKLEQNITCENPNPTNPYSVKQLVIPEGTYVTIDLNGCTLDRGFDEDSNNSWNGTGSVLTVSEEAVLIIKDTSTEKTGNITGGYGKNCSGGIHNCGTLIIEDGRIQSNYCSGNGFGAGIGNLGTMIMNGGTIYNNEVKSGDAGGGIYNSGTLIMNGGEISTNQGNSGGGIYNDTGTVNIYGGSICYNKTPSDTYDGAGIYNKGGTVTIKECSITENKTNASGGGIYSFSYGDSTAYLNIEGGTIQGNTAGRQSTSSDSSYKYGGGICVYSGVLNLKGGTITGNTAVNNHGRAGGIYVASDATMNVEGLVTVKDNIASVASSGVDDNSATGANIVVEPEGVIYVTGELAEDSELCLYPIVDSSWQLPAVNHSRRVFTSGLNALSADPLGSVDNFTSEVDGTAVGINEDGEIYVGEKECTVNFLSDNGDITVSNPQQSFPADSYFILPECAYTAPSTYDFSGWKVGDVDESKQPGYHFQLTGYFVEVTAQFEDKSQVPEFEMQSVSLLSTGMLGVNFFMRLPCREGTDVETCYGSCKMNFSISSKGEAKDRITKTADLNTDFTNSTGEYYGFTCNITSIQMADTITAEFVYDSENEQKSITKQYSVKKYLNNLDMDGCEEKTQNLIKAMADYGYYAQPYLSKTNGWTIGVDYARMDKRYTASYNISDIKSEIAGGNDKFLYDAQNDYKDYDAHDIIQLDYTLKLDSGIDIIAFFTPSPSYTGEPVITIDGSTPNYKSESDIVTGNISDSGGYYTRLEDGTYVLVYSGMSFKDLNTLHTFMMQTDDVPDGVIFKDYFGEVDQNKMDGYGKSSLIVSPLCFVYKLVAPESDESDERNFGVADIEAQNFGAALYKLYLAAAAISEQN